MNYLFEEYGILEKSMKNSFEIPFLFLDGHLSGDFKETNKL